MHKLLFFILFVLIFQDFHGQEDHTLINEQKNIVAALSGHKILDNGLIIKSRSKKEERELAREYLFDLMESIDLEPKFQEYTLPNVNPLVDILFSPYKGANVYSILPATTPSDEYVLIGAHYDTERHCPGAIDNATGVTIGYGVIRKLAMLDTRDINVILVYFDQEEEDVIGSQAFAQKMKKEKYKLRSVHTIDTMGWDRDGDKAVELGLASESLAEIYIRIGKKLGIPIYTTNVTSTDHYSFWELGYNVTSLTDELLNGDYAPFKDTPDDVYETVNFGYVNSTTQLVYEVIKELIKK